MKGKEERELELTVGTLTRPTMISFPSRTMVWYLTMRLSEGTVVAGEGKKGGGQRSESRGSSEGEGRRKGRC